MTPSTVLSHMAWAQLWQVTSLILVVGGLSHKISRNRPHLAFVLWTLVIVKCLMPPIWSCPTGVFSWAQLEYQDSPLSAEPTVLLVTDSDSEAPTSRVGAATGPVCRGKGSTIVSAGKLIMATDSFSPWTTLLVIWLTGVALLTGFAVLGWCRCRRVLRVSKLPTPPSLESLVAEIARARIGLRRTGRIVVTTECITPCVFGVLKPAIVIPQSLLWGRATQDIEPILAHELVHLRRGDAVFSLLQVAAQIIWWFHPLVWWANRQATRVTESCCDVEVLAALDCQPTTYAKCLIDALEGGRAMAPACPGLRPAEVTSRRLEDIMRLTRKFNVRTRLWCLVAAIVTAIVVLPGARLAVRRAVESLVVATAARRSSVT